MTPMEIACDHFDRPLGLTDSADFVLCNAQAGEFCNWLDSSGDRHPREQFHPERIADAAAMTQDSPDPPSKEDFERAVEETGLV